MKIKTSYANIMSAISSLRAILSDKKSADALRNLIFKITPKGVKLLAYNTLVTCYTGLECKVEGLDDVEVEYKQLKADILKVLGNFKSLKRTQVTSVEIDFQEANALITIRETASQAILDDANIPDVIKSSYNHTSKYRIGTPKLNKGIVKELDSKDLSLTGTEISAIDLNFYISALLSTLSSDIKDAIATRVCFTGDDIWTAPQVYFAIMQNRLDKTLRDFVLSQSEATFLKTYLEGLETVLFSKIELENSVILKFASKKGIAYINASTTKGCMDCTGYKAHTLTGLAVDKPYFTDILGRLGSEDTVAVTIQINDNNTAWGNIESKYFKQSFSGLKARLNIPDFEDTGYLKTREDGSHYLLLEFNIKPDLFRKLLFTQVNPTSPAYLYFEPAVNNTGIRVAVCDETGIWQTKVSALAAKTNFAWED